MHQKLRSPWIMHIKRLLDHCGLSYMYHDGVAHTDPAEAVWSVKERLNDQFIQKWRAELSSSSKMRTYRLFKLDLLSEKYLTLLPHLHSILAKFRLSCHSLADDTLGHHYHLKKEYARYAMLQRMKSTFYYSARQHVPSQSSSRLWLLETIIFPISFIFLWIHSFLH